MVNKPNDPYLLHHWTLIWNSKTTGDIRNGVYAFERFWRTYNYGRYAPDPETWQGLEEMVRKGPYTRIKEYEE